MVYSEKIAKVLANIPHARSSPNANAVGTGANFSCGSFVRFSLEIDIETSVITDISFQSNGCGYIVVTANLLSESLLARSLTELHGLSDTELSETIPKVIGPIPASRTECLNVCFQALRSALADFRRLKINEFSGEKALICTCFGVTEERIEAVIKETNAISIDDVAEVCNAGRGCGSCRMMIEEMIEGRVIHS